jgi:uncharacterized RDD family membrane protein YckC
MSSNVEGTAVAGAPRNREIVVSFSPERVKAPFFLRCGAFLIDYLLVIAFPVICLLTARFSGLDGARLLSSEWNTAGWLIALLVAVSDLVLLPAFSGQSVGKIVTGLRIVRIDGTAPSIRTIVLRQTVGYLLTLFSFGIGFLVSVFSSKGRALQDYLTGTVVIYADRNVRKIS